MLVRRESTDHTEQWSMACHSQTSAETGWTSGLIRMDLTVTGHIPLSNSVHTFLPHQLDFTSNLLMPSGALFHPFRRCMHLPESRHTSVISFAASAGTKQTLTEQTSMCPKLVLDAVRSESGTYCLCCRFHDIIKIERHHRDKTDRSAWCTQAVVWCRFHIMGGECNYLLRLSPSSKELEFVPDQEWKTPCMQAWQDADIKYVLREAEKLLLDTAYQLRLPVKVRTLLMFMVSR